MVNRHTCFLKFCCEFCLIFRLFCLYICHHTHRSFNVDYKHYHRHHRRRHHHRRRPIHTLSRTTQSSRQRGSFSWRRNCSRTLLRDRSTALLTISMPIVPCSLISTVKRQLCVVEKNQNKNFITTLSTVPKRK
jgi:hypothetical protein